MVILETAAIGAAGYGLYRGGDAAIRKGKETHKELQRERVRQSQRTDLSSKIKTRQERIAQLVHLRQQGPTSTGPSGNVEIPNSDDIETRQRNVLEKLKSTRSQSKQQQQPPSVGGGTQKQTGPGGKLKSLFTMKK